MRALLAWGLVALTILPSCTVSPPDTEKTDATPARISLGGHNGYLLDNLHVAVTAGDDEMAWRLIELLRVRPLSADEDERVDAYEDVLTGRALVRRLELALRVHRVDGADQLLLLIASKHSAELVLHLPPADLRRIRLAVDPEGLEGQDFATTRVSSFKHVALAPDATTTLDLGPCGVDLGRALALRDTWKLVLRAGRIRAGDEVYPSGEIAVPVYERVLLAEGLDAEPMAPDEFCGLVLAYSQTPTESFATELLAAAVRIPPGERGTALRKLAPVLRAIGDVPARVGIELAPALRWVARTHDPGTDISSWAAWTHRWVRDQDAPVPTVGGLDLPDRSSASNRDARSRNSGLDLP